MNYDEVCVVFENGEIHTVCASEWEAQEVVDCSCMPEDLGERFRIRRYSFVDEIPVRRHSV